MIPYLTCEAAAERLEPFIDGELPVDEQVALESHLRWCAVCEARLDDMQLIGCTLRGRHSLDMTRPIDGLDLTTMRSSVLERVRAEREQSVPVLVGKMFVDWRLLWPALGATAAVMVCVAVAAGIFNAATELDQRESLAAMIDMLANPGSDENPRVLDGRVSLPRALEPDLVLNSVAEDDVAFAVSAIVTREGRIANYELLFSERATGRRRQRAAELDVDAPAVMDAVKRSRFAPAHDADGPVAVNVVWLVTRTTVKPLASASNVTRLKRLRPEVPVLPDVVVRPPAEIMPGADLKVDEIDEIAASAPA
jgi:hypothetical protein